MKTGQDVMESGLYVSDCCGEEVMLAVRCQLSEMPKMRWAIAMGIGRFA